MYVYPPPSPRKPAASLHSAFHSRTRRKKRLRKHFLCKSSFRRDYPIWNFLTAFFIRIPYNRLIRISALSLAGIGGRIRCALIPIRCAEISAILLPDSIAFFRPETCSLDIRIASLPDMHKSLPPRLFQILKHFPISAAGLPHRWYIPLYQYKLAHTQEI